MEKLHIIRKCRTNLRKDYHEPVKEKEGQQFRFPRRQLLCVKTVDLRLHLM